MDNFDFKGKLFGANVEIALFGIDDPKISHEICKTAYEEGVRLESIFNFFDETSEISRLNEKRKMKMSPEFVDVLSLSLQLCDKTLGKYDVTLGKNFKNRKEGETIVGLEGSYKDVSINGDSVSLDSKDILIDLGSIAKGYITDKIGEKLIEKGVEEFLINARGDILVKGFRAHEIKIQHPRNPRKSIASLLIKDGGIATSGDYKQFGRDFSESHILNSGTYASVSVFAESLMIADLYSTVFSVITRTEIQKFMKSKKDMMAMGIRGNLEVEHYNGFKDLVVSIDAEASVETVGSSEDLIGLRKVHSEGDSEEDDWITDGDYSGGGAGQVIRPGNEHNADHPDFIGGAS